MIHCYYLNNNLDSIAAAAVVVHHYKLKDTVTIYDALTITQDRKTNNVFEFQTIKNSTHILEIWSYLYPNFELPRGLSLLHLYHDQMLHEESIEHQSRLYYLGLLSFGSSIFDPFNSMWSSIIHPNSYITNQNIIRRGTYIQEYNQAFERI